MRAVGKTAQLLAVSLSLVAVGIIGPAHADQNGDKNQIVNVIATYQRALNGNDVNGVLKIYAEDGVFMPEHSPSSVGSAAIREAYERVFKAIDLNVAFNVVEVKLLGDNWAFVRTTSDGTIKINASGAEVTNETKELFLLQKQSDGKWKLARYAFSANTRPQ